MKIRTDCICHQGSVKVGLLQELPACIEIVREIIRVQCFGNPGQKQYREFIVESKDDLRSEFCISLLHRSDFVMSPDIQLHRFLRWQEIVQATDFINFYPILTRKAAAFVTCRAVKK